MAVSGCQTSQQTGILAGGAIGAGTGALSVSAVSGGSAGGTIAGGVIGAGTGALIGNAVSCPHRHCARWGFRPEWQPRLLGLLPLTIKVGRRVTRRPSFVKKSPARAGLDRGANRRARAGDKN